MVRRPKTVAGERTEPAHHLAKAQQFLDVARVALRDQLCDAAMLNAIHAGISAADAVTITIILTSTARDSNGGPPQAAGETGLVCLTEGTGSCPP